MKNVILFIVFLSCIACRSNIKFIYSPDKKNCLSQFEYRDSEGKSYTIFTYGKANSTKLPNSFIRVRNKWRDAWYGLIKWNGEEAIFYFTYHDFEDYNLENSLLKMYEMQSEQEFSSYFFNKVPNNYIKVSSIDKYNTKQ